MSKAMEILKNKIVSRMNQNPVIHDISHVSIQIKTTGMLFWKKEFLYIAGRVNMDKEKTEIDKIIAEECEGIDVQDNLRVQHR